MPVLIYPISSQQKPRSLFSSCDIQFHSEIRQSTDVNTILKKHFCFWVNFFHHLFKRSQQLIYFYTIHYSAVFSRCSLFKGFHFVSTKQDVIVFAKYSIYWQWNVFILDWDLDFPLSHLIRSLISQWKRVCASRSHHDKFHCHSLVHPRSLSSPLECLMKF